MLQGTPQNPVQGLEGRALVLSRLGQLLQTLPGAGGAQARACHLLPALTAPLAQPGAGPTGDTAPSAPPLQAATVLTELLRALAPVWPTAPVQGLPAGDVWPHRWAGEATGDVVGPAVANDGDLGTSGWVPLHAMGQALVATLGLPLQRAGHSLQGLQTLTACADHATCSLMLTAGVVVPRHTRLLSRKLALGDEAVVECRALTVALFDELTARVQGALQTSTGLADAPLPVARVVQAVHAVLATSTPLMLQTESDGALF